MDILFRFITPGTIFLLTLIFGIWLSKYGKPYNVMIFNVHKLTALAAVIVTAIQIYRVSKVMESQTLIIVLAVFIGLCAAALFATGALMSLEKLNYDILLAIHKITPILAVLAMVAIIYLLPGGM